MIACSGDIAREGLICCTSGVYVKAINIYIKIERERERDVKKFVALSNVASKIYLPKIAASANVRSNCIMKTFTN